MMQWLQIEHAWIYITIALVLVYALGVWLGAKGKVVVYRNYYDVMLVAGLYLLPVLMTPLFILLSGNGEVNELNSGLFIVLLALEGLLLVFILARTVLDNLNPLKALLALYVKIPTAVFFSFNLYEAFTAKRGQHKRKSFFWAVFMVPVIHALVHDKKTGKLPARFSR